MRSSVKCVVPTAPWPIQWERDHRIDDGHEHEWETVLVGPPRHNRYEMVDRCRHCQAPRCDRHNGPHDRCLERRHHGSLHIFPSGEVTPVGGYISEKNLGGTDV
jgi:hypothetical protein